MAEDSGSARAEPLSLPCGTCIGCRMSKARDWTVRCQLELQAHERACWVTLTYDDAHVPLSLRKSDLSGWLKRLRARVHDRGARVRFFASGEYGEQNGRPHYHACIFGLPPVDEIAACWTRGFVRVDELNAARIAYTAGYCAKKVGHSMRPEVRVDHATGEEYLWEPPFILMSRRPGIGGHARVHTASWRRNAINAGRPVPVPRFLHEAWKRTASAEDIDVLRRERTDEALAKAELRDVRKIGETIAIAKQANQARNRRL